MSYSLSIDLNHDHINNHIIGDNLMLLYITNGSNDFANSLPTNKSRLFVFDRCGIDTEMLISILQQKHADVHIRNNRNRLGELILIDVMKLFENKFSRRFHVFIESKCLLHSIEYISNNVPADCYVIASHHGVTINNKFFPTTSTVVMKNLIPS